MYHECLPWESDLGVKTNKEMRPNNLEIEPNTCSQFHSESHCKKKKQKTLFLPNDTWTIEYLFQKYVHISLT